MSALLAVLALAAAQEAAPDEAGIEFFEARVRPLLAERCYGCHSARAEKLKGKLRLDVPAALLKGGDRGPALVPGDPDRSLLIRSVRWADEELRMPPKKKLAAKEIAILEAWVRRGAPAPFEPVVRPEGTPAGRHWAFQLPREPALPEVRLRDWPRTPIDAFLLAALEAKGLAPAPPADPRTLLRRASIALTGLPPSPEELESFLSDPSPESYARAIDRLLASPRYGERWGRYWLDVARYADTKGYVFREETQFVHSHLYRDWVIRAFNEDLPYDRFLLLQLAADRAATDRRDLPAMGFLTVGRGFTKVVHEIVDDRIDVVTRGLLGLTASCARCHDHKYDPIPTRDYYSLYGIFAGSVQKTVRIEGAPGDDPVDRELRRRQDRLESYLRTRTAQLLDRARAKASEYLQAALEAERLPSEQFFQMLGADDINPALVRRWEGYLLRTRAEGDAVFALWHALASVPEPDLPARAPVVLDALRGRLNPRVAEAFSGTPPASMREVAGRYGRLLAGFQAKTAPLADPSDEELRRILHGPGAAASLPEGSITELQWYFEDDARNELGRLESEIDRWLLSSERAPAHAVILEDKAVQEVARVFRRGNPAQRGEEAPRSFLSALGGRPFESGSGRLELAREIASARNPLTARVLVNRVWALHFGAGLVRTPSDFGVRGEPPTHPELLDWLARRFVADGASTPHGMNWSIKALHRLILLSSAYRQGGEASPAARASDPDNRLLGRMPRMRLDFEALRDSMLAVSGALDLAEGGRAVDLTLAPSPPRRTVYGYIDRLNLPGVYRTFDFANPDMHSPERHSTSVPQQALYLLNSPFVRDQARLLAARAAREGGEDPDRRLRRIYALALGREPSPGETAAGREFLAQAVPAAPAPAAAPWSYGTGEVDPATGGIEGFRPMPHFGGKRWQTSPHPTPGQASLTAAGGHPGGGPAGTVVRRWTAPRAGTFSVSGTLSQQEREGDGVRARIASRAGEIATWTAKQMSAETKLDGIRLKAGEPLDFAVESRADAHGDEFSWSVTVRTAGTAKDGPSEWSSAADFGGPGPIPLDSWERFAQVILLSNEFHFVD